MKDFILKTQNKVLLKFYMVVQNKQTTPVFPKKEICLPILLLMLVALILLFIYYSDIY